jgi:hypothetical protein
MSKLSPPVSNIAPPAKKQPTEVARAIDEDDPPAPRNSKSLHTQFAAVVRWLHIYVSLLGFTALAFFAITGITLNHPTWFGIDAAVHTTEHKGELKKEWLNLPLPAGVTSPQAESGEIDYAAQVAKLEVVEHLRAAHKLKGTVGEFRVDERECTIIFKGPGYSADVFVNRDDGTYQLTEVKMGVVAIINDLHKGRDTGPAWSWVIDLSALLTVFVAITGTILIFYIKRKRWSGIITAVVGTILFALLYVLFVP